MSKSTVIAMVGFASYVKTDRKEKNCCVSQTS